MNKKIKSFFLAFNNFKKKGLILALLFLVIFGITFPFDSTLAQQAGIPSLSCGPLELACQIGSWVLSIMIKIVILLFFGIPLLISALAAAITGLILGWIISPDFISLKFTQNAFVDIGLSITRGFSNMFFILFLVVIALATVLRIQEYRAKKTLATLIMIALLVNFSSVFCGIIIDFTNTVMDFFLSHITGLNGFIQIIYNSALALWNIIIANSFDLWANISAAMQVIISLVFNWFAAFIFILFSALFTMRYIMLWILVILAPIAFVSYILPITRRGRSLLNWRKWWEQLIEWSTIGITAGFFLYLGFLMISMINANPIYFVRHPDLSWGGGGLGLANNILPYLIPLILLWIAYKEVKQTSAMFAREIIDIPEKVTKAAVSAAVIAGTAGAGMAAVGAAKGLPGAVGAFQKRMDTYATEHKETTGGRIAGWMSRRAGTLRGTQIYTDEEGEKHEVYEGVVGKIRKPVEDLATKGGGVEKWMERQKDKYPGIATTIGWMEKQASKGLEQAGLSTSLKENLGLSKTEEVAGRKLISQEKNMDGDGKWYRYKEETKKETKDKKIGEMTGYRKVGNKVTFEDPITKKERDATEKEKDKGKVEWEEEKKGWVKTDQELTDKERRKGYLITGTRKLEAQKGVVPTIKKSLEDAWKEIEKKVGKFKSSAEEAWEDAIKLALKEIEEAGGISDESLEELRDKRYVPDNFERRTKEDQREYLEKTLKEGWLEKGSRKKQKTKQPEPEEKPPEPAPQLTPRPPKPKPPEPGRGERKREI